MFSWQIILDALYILLLIVAFLGEYKEPKLFIAQTALRDVKLTTLPPSLVQK
jgi:hypothetical protein